MKHKSKSNEEKRAYVRKTMKRMRQRTRARATKMELRQLGVVQ